MRFGGACEALQRGTNGLGVECNKGSFSERIQLKSLTRQSLLGVRSSHIGRNSRPDV